MSSSKKNLMVGITMMVGLVLLGWMLIKFGGKVVEPFAAAKVPVRLVSARATGVADGSQVLYRGVSVGRVVSVNMAPDQLKVYIDLRLDGTTPIPANVEGLIQPQGLIGAGAVINLELTSAVPQGQIKAGDQIPARVATYDLLPKEFTELANDLRLTSKEFRESKLIEHLDQTVLTFQKQANKAGDVLDSLQATVSDPKMRKDLQDAVANFRTTTEIANRVGANLEKFSGNLDKISTDASATLTQAKTTIAKTETHIDKLSGQVSDRLLQLAKLLDSVQSIAGKVDQGKGTAGQLVNDPKLYEAMVDTARQLSATTTDLKRLVEQWEQEGVTLKFGK